MTLLSPDNFETIIQIKEECDRLYETLSKKLNHTVADSTKTTIDKLFI